MRRLLAVILPLCFLLCGCWDYKDLNKLSIVTGMAFGDEGKILLEIVDRTTGPKKDGLRTRVVEATGRDTQDAIDKLSKGLDFALYYGAMAVVIFDRDEPCPDVLDWLIKNREVRETVYVLFGDSGLLQTEEEENGIAAYTLRDIIDASEDEKPLELYKMVGAGNG
jgi:spore germination protein KC